MINQQIVDMDYSPVRFKLSDGFQQHPVVWNISQEAEEILRDLFYNKFITVLRAMSKDLTISLFFQINEAGSLLLKHVPQGLLSDCHRVLYETLPDGSLSNLLHVRHSEHSFLAALYFQVYSNSSGQTGTSRAENCFVGCIKVSADSCRRKVQKPYTCN
jgi:hypothetical protein